MKYVQLTVYMTVRTKIPLIYLSRSQPRRVARPFPAGFGLFPQPRGILMGSLRKLKRVSIPLKARSIDRDNTGNRAKPSLLAIRRIPLCFASSSSFRRCLGSYVFALPFRPDAYCISSCAASPFARKWSTAITSSSFLEYFVFFFNEGSHAIPHRNSRHYPVFFLTSHRLSPRETQEIFPSSNI